MIAGGHFNCFFAGYEIVAFDVEVIALGIGDEVNEAELMKITSATGGGVFIATDPSKIGQIFLQAIALRPELRVLYTTGNTITDKMKALLAEGTHFLRKPYTQYQLQSSVKDMLAPQ